MRMYLAAVALACAALSAPAIAEDAVSIVTKAGPLGKPEAGQGLVVFYRPGSIMGAALGCTVHEGDKEHARLGSGKFYPVNIAPGKHTFFTEGEATDVLNLEVEPDETYFVKCKIGVGIMAGRANLSPSDQAEFAKKAKGLAQWKGSNKK